MRLKVILLALLLGTGSALAIGCSDTSLNSDVSDDGGNPDGEAPKGVQPTTTPDNLGCTVTRSWVGTRRDSRSNRLGDAVLVLACVITARATRRRGLRWRST